MTDWAEIHKDFGEKNEKNWEGETYQQEWEEAGITYQEAQEWIKAGFEPKKYWKVEGWKNLNFNLREVGEWIKLGLNHQEYEFSTYLRWKGYQPSPSLNLDQLRTEFAAPKNYLDCFYPCKKRAEVTKLGISYRNLTGELDLSDFVNLKQLNCSYNKLNSLNVSNCQQLTEIDGSDNLLTNITLPTNPTNLKILKLYNNNFPPQDLSFLTPYTNLEELRLGNWGQEKIIQNIYNRFAGSLNYLNDMKKLEALGIGNTDVNKVDYTKLPGSLRTIWCSTKERPSCKLTAIAPLLEGFAKYGWCRQCQQINTSRNWCRLCTEQNIKQLSSQELVKNFIKQQSYEYEHRKVKWIPYNQFTNIEYLAEGGFSKIYKAYWSEGMIEEWNYKEKKSEVLVSGIDVALKILNNSQNITLEFLQEIANTKLADYEDNIVKCYGISQNPATGNYLMVMQYIEESNLRDYLKNNASELSWENRLNKLHSIASGLSTIHEQGLVHRDFHSGNILNGKNVLGLDESFITDFGLSQITNSQSREGEIFGVLPYVAPEVLQGQPYTRVSDIYSFGIIAYEVLSGLPPYCDMDHDIGLALKICQGLRPKFQIRIPQLLEDLIEWCWEADPLQRPDSHVLSRILLNWCNEIYDKEDTEFTRQLQSVEEYNKTLSDEIKFPKYNVHKGAVYTSRLLPTKEITQLLQSSQLSNGFSQTDISRPVDDISISLTEPMENLNIQEKQVQNSPQAQIQIPPK